MEGRAFAQEAPAAPPETSTSAQPIAAGSAAGPKGVAPGLTDEAPKTRRRSTGAVVAGATLAITGAAGFLIGLLIATAPYVKGEAPGAVITLTSIPCVAGGLPLLVWGNKKVPADPQPVAPSRSSARTRLLVSRAWRF